MAVAPQPHPNSVFRYLKTAYRNWMKTGAITLGAISNTTTATAVSASGTILPNVGVSNVALTLNQGTVVASTIMAPVIHPSGTFTGSFGKLATGTYQASAKGIGVSPTPAVSNTFTIT